MDAKELRKTVIEFLLSKDENSDTTQNTKILIKRAVKLGFTEPELNTESNETNTENNEEKIEIQAEEIQAKEKIEIPEKKVRKPREKKVVEIKENDEPKDDTILAVLKPEIKTVKQPEKNDNSIYWIIAIAVIGIAIIIFLKKYNNGKETNEFTG